MVQGKLLFAIIRERRMDKNNYADMLSDLLDKEEMDDDLIRDQMLTMLIAGHDTSTALLAWTLHLLGRHPEAMERVREEVEQVLGDEILNMEIQTSSSISTPLSIISTNNPFIRTSNSDNRCLFRGKR